MRVFVTVKSVRGASNDMESEPEGDAPLACTAREPGVFAAMPARTGTLPPDLVTLIEGMGLKKPRSSAALPVKRDDGDGGFHKVAEELGSRPLNDPLADREMRQVGRGGRHGGQQATRRRRSQARLEHGEAGHGLAALRVAQVAVYRSCTKPSSPARSKSTSLALTLLQVAAGLSLFVMRSRRPCRAGAVTEGVVRGYGKPAGESRARAWRSQPSPLPEWREVDPIRGIPASRTITRPKLPRGRLIAKGDAQRRLCSMGLWR